MGDGHDTFEHEKVEHFLHTARYCTNHHTKRSTMQIDLCKPSCQLRQHWQLLVLGQTTQELHNNIAFPWSF